MEKTVPEKPRKRRSPEQFAHLPAARSQETSLVYFFEAASVGLFKIGYSRKLLLRLGSIQLASPVVLSLVRVTPGGRAQELEWHRRFADDRSHGEWFRASDALRAAVMALPEGTPDGLTCDTCGALLCGFTRYAICRACWNVEWAASKMPVPPCTNCGRPRPGRSAASVRTRTGWCVDCVKTQQRRCACGEKRAKRDKTGQCERCKSAALEAQRTRAIDLGRQGYPICDVAQMMGLGQTLVTMWLREAGVSIRRGRVPRSHPRMGQPQASLPM